MSAPALAFLDETGRPRAGDPTVPLVRPDDLGVLRGESVFETLRVFGGRAFRLVEHLDRMAASAARLQLDLPSSAVLTDLAGCALDGYGLGDGALRLVCTKGPDAAPGVAFALASPVSVASERARADGVAAVTLTLGTPATMRADAPWLLGGVKSTSYAPAMASLRAAEGYGATDAVWVSTDGEVLEAPTATVVLVQDGQVLTPPPDAVGILPGTTVGFFGDEVGRRRISVEELRGADEAMLLSSVRGVVPMLTLDGRPIGTGEIGPRTAAMRAAYEAAVRAR